METGWGHLGPSWGPHVVFGNAPTSSGPDLCGQELLGAISGLSWIPIGVFLRGLLGALLRHVRHVHSIVVDRCVAFPPCMLRRRGRASAMGNMARASVGTHRGGPRGGDADVGGADAELGHTLTADGVKRAPVMAITTTTTTTTTGGGGETSRWRWWRWCFDGCAIPWPQTRSLSTQNAPRAADIHVSGVPPWMCLPSALGYKA